MVERWVCNQINLNKIWDGIFVWPFFYLTIRLKWHVVTNTKQDLCYFYTCVVLRDSLPLVYGWSLPWDGRWVGFLQGRNQYLKSCYKCSRTPLSHRNHKLQTFVSKQVFQAGDSKQNKKLMPSLWLYLCGRLIWLIENVILRSWGTM